MEQNNAVQKTVQNGADSFFLHLNQFRLLVSKFGAAHLSAWMIHNRATYPGLLFRAGTIAVGIVMAAVAMHMVSTGFGRIVEDVILQAGYSVGLIAFFVVIGIMFHGTVLSFRHVFQTWNEDKPEAGPKLLAATTWTPPDISPDILVCAFDEKAAFEKAAMAGKATTHAIWAVVIPPKKKQVAIWTADRETDFFFDRGSEPFTDTIPAGFGLPAGLDHTAEDEKQYQKYVTWFCQFYLKWRDAAKLEADKGRAKQTLFEVMEAHAKAVSAALCFLLFCLPAFGQSKTRQVDEALGTRIREIPDVGEKITYAFQEGGKEKYYTRTGDGVKDYTALLQSTSGLVRFDDQGGQLIAIQKNGEVVARAAGSVERVNLSPVGPNGAPYLQESTTGDPIRPRGVLTAPDVENTPVTDQPTRFHIPDSSSTAAMFEGWKETIRDVEEKTGRAAEPAFDFSWWLFGKIFVFLFVMASILWHFAKTASEEGIMGVWGETIFISSFLVMVHQNCSALLMCVLWLGESFIFVKGIHLMITTTTPLFISCLVWLGVMWAIRKTHNKIVPNIKGLVGRGRNTNTAITPY